MPDSSTYTSIAGELRKAYAAGNGILTVRTEFRMLGYPVLLAAIAEFTPEKTYAPLYIIQIAFAVLSSLVLFLTLRRLGLNAVSGGVLALIFLAAYPLPLASFVLTDAINNALTAIALCLLVLLCVAAQPRSMGLIVLLGGAGMATAFLVREFKPISLAYVLTLGCCRHLEPHVVSEGVLRERAIVRAPNSSDRRGL